MDGNVQPDPNNPEDEYAILAAESWFYDKVQEHIIRFALRPTDDQKQVVTGGEKLYNRLIADDCETSASFIVGVHKTFMAIRAYLVHKKVWNDVIFGDFKITKITDEIVIKLTGFSVEKNNNVFTDLEQARETVFALANILRQYHLTVELSVGSASTAAFGKPSKPSGHCFAMLDATHVKNQHDPRCFILEGTNWITQKAQMGIHGLVDPKIYEQITRIATLMVAATQVIKIDGKNMFKTGKNAPNKDHGKALALVQERCNTAFWRAIYAKGNSLMSFIHGDKCTYGVKAADVINRVKNVKPLPVTYSQASSTLHQQGISMENTKIERLVQEVSIAEAVPPWQKQQWDKILDTYVKCKVVEEELCEDINHYRFAFTHQVFTHPQFSLCIACIVSLIIMSQVFDHVDEECYKKCCIEIKKRIENSNFASVNDFYKSIHDEWLEKTKSNPERKTWPIGLKNLLVETESEYPNFDKALGFLNKLGSYVKIIKTYMCMQSVIIICSVHKDNISTLDVKMTAWVSVLAAAFQQRLKLDQAIHLHTNNLRVVN
jgi:hypothetical protein